MNTSGRNTLPADPHSNRRDGIKLPDIFCSGSVVDRLRNEFEVVREELRVGLVECRLEAEVIGFVRVHVSRNHDTTENGFGVAKVGFTLTVTSSKCFGAFM